MRIRKLRRWLRRLFWHEPLHVDEVVDDYITFDYRGTPITLTRKQKMFWDSGMNRRDKNKVAEDVKIKIRKGELELIEVDGKRLTIKKQK